MLRRPPRSTLFPTRRSSDLAFAAAVRIERQRIAAEQGREPPDDHRAPGRAAVQFRAAVGERLRIGTARSEEHTSELQSLRHLVCRLLLEKKKKKINQNYTRQ